MPRALLSPRAVRAVRDAQVETIGDCYLVAGGLMLEDEDGMTTVCERSSR